MDSIFISFGIKMTEILAIDNVFLKIKSSQGRVNESFITGNHTLRKKRRKYKPMNVAYEIVAIIAIHKLMLLVMIKVCHVRKGLI